MKLTRLIPLVILISALVAAIASLFVGERLARESALTEVELSTASRLGQLELVIEAALRRHDHLLVEEIVAGLGGDRTVESAMVVGGDEVIVASTLREQMGHPVSEFPWGAALLPASRARAGPLVRRDASRLRVDGAIALEVAEPSLVAQPRAVLVIRHDVQANFAAAVRGVRATALVSSSFLLVVAGVAAWVLRRRIAPRAERVLGAARRIAAGDFEARTDLLGGDELATIGGAVDQMASDLRRRHDDAVESEHRYRSIFDHVVDGIFVSSSDKKYIDANPAALRLVGYSLDELRSMTMQQLVQPEELAVRPFRFDALMDRGTLRVNRTLVSKSGERVPCEISAVKLSDGRMLGLVRDLRPGQEADRLRAQVSVNERLAVLGTLAAGVGHELNNPLTFIVHNLAAAERLVTELPEAQQAGMKSLLVDARDGADRIARIIGDLRIFARAGDDLAPTAVRLDAVVRTAVNLVGPWVRERARLSVDVPPLPQVQADERRLCQVLLNLITNAAQAMPPSRVSTQNEITLKARVSTPEAVVIEVIDNGTGISPEVLPRIFDAYFTTKAPEVGTGLGLAISRDLLTRMGATLEVARTGPEGTCFAITVKVDVAVTAPPAEAPGPSSPPTPRRVLIIDDEPLVARVLTRLLKGHTVSVAGDPSAGLSLCAEQEFDLVLCDLSMPGGGGKYFFEELRSRRPALARRVAFVTGGASTAEAAHFLEATKQPVLHKPFAPEALMALLRSPPGA